MFKLVLAIIAIIIVCSVPAMGQSASMPSIYLPGPTYHPFGWEHDGLVIPAGWLNIYDDGIRYEYMGNVIVSTPTSDIKGSLYQVYTGSPWFIVDEHGMIISSGGPRSPLPVGMSYTYFRYN